MGYLNKNCKDNEKKAKYIGYMKDVFREQRHDYMNYYQIIYGYLQLGKLEEAVGKIEKIIQLNSNLSQIYKLSLFHLSIYLDKNIREMEDLNYIVDLNVDNDTENSICFIENEEEIIGNLDLIFNYFIGEGIQSKKHIDIKVEEFEDRISFIFTGEDKISTLIKNSKSLEILDNNGKVNIIFKYKSPMECLNI